MNDDEDYVDCEHCGGDCQLWSDWDDYYDEDDEGDEDL